MALVSEGVIRMPLAPAVTMFSIAVTWLALSPSNLPAAVSSFAPAALAAFCAPSFIFTKNGFVSVFVTSPTTIWPLPAEPFDAFVAEAMQLLALRPIARAAASRAGATICHRRQRRNALAIFILLPLSGCV